MTTPTQQHPSIETTKDMNLVELVHFLYLQGGMATLKKFFKFYNYKVSYPTEKQNIVGIKYIDGKNKIWNTKWSREARGRFYYINKDETITLKDGLQRGAELLTKAHIEDGVNDTQDMADKNIDMFDERQKTIMRKFTGVNEINGVLTGKVDGSLIEINIYPQGSKQYSIMVEFLENKRVEDPFACVLLDYCVSNNLPLINVSTQGTLLISDDMRCYLITCIHPYIDCDLIKEETNLENWIRMSPLFVEFIMRQLETFPKLYNEPMFIKYEAVCKNRTTYKGKLYTGLAVGYSYSGISLLGIMFKGKYIPHYLLPESQNIVPHPVHCRVTTTTQVFDIMRELNNVIMGKEENIRSFMEKWFPGHVDYSKIKLPIYYLTHKIKSYNISTLTALPGCVDKYFPIIGILKDFNENIEPKLSIVIYDVIRYLDDDITSDKSLFYELLNNKAKTHVDNYRNNPGDINKKSMVFKMIMNLCKDKFREKIDEITMREWGRYGETYQMFIINAILKINAWEHIENLEKMTIKVKEALNSKAKKGKSLKNIAYDALASSGSVGV